MQTHIHKCIYVKVKLKRCFLSTVILNFKSSHDENFGQGGIIGLDETNPHHHISVVPGCFHSGARGLLSYCFCKEEKVSSSLCLIFGVLGSEFISKHVTFQGVDPALLGSTPSTGSQWRQHIFSRKDERNPTKF